MECKIEKWKVELRLRSSLVLLAAVSICYEEAWAKEVWEVGFRFSSSSLVIELHITILVLRTVLV